MCFFELNAGWRQHRWAIIGTSSSFVKKIRRKCATCSLFPKKCVCAPSMSHFVPKDIACCLEDKWHSKLICCRKKKYFSLNRLLFKYWRLGKTCIAVTFYEQQGSNVCKSCSKAKYPCQNC